MNRLFLATISAVLLPTFAASAHAEQPVDTALYIAELAFADDLQTPINEIGPYGHSRIPYADLNSIPQRFREFLAVVKPGVTRAGLTKNFRENGGITLNEYYLALEGLPGGRVLALRVIWRPSGMPEKVYADPARRRKWIVDNKPKELPTDVAVRTSKPFYSGVYID
ncbi:MAG: hypothetical protein ACO1QR_00245 [Chthoniobacteraceae bacterium]